MKRVKEWMAERKDGFLGALRGLEAQALIFPVLVVLCASITFMCGGHIQAWQWWGPVVAMLSLPWVLRRDTQPSMKVWTCLAFLGLLAVVWLLAGLFIPLSGSDTCAYHLPATRLLIAGWNPVTDCTPEDLASSMGVTLTEMRYWHVLFTFKAVWIFNAVAYSFTGTPMNLNFPLFSFLLLTTAMQIWRLLRGMPVVVRLLGVTLLWGGVFMSSMIVDATIYLASFGLLAAMGRRLRGESNTLLPLIVFSFWMMVAKQPGLFACFIFWVAFSALLLWQERLRILPRLAAVGALLVILFLTASASPILSSWIHYGHPLYPTYTVDEARFPAVDITEDFLICNEDAKAMGHLGAFVHAYISPALTGVWYRWKLEQETFAPWRVTWKQTSPDGLKATYPLSWMSRLNILLPLLILFIWGDRAFRFIATTILLALFCFPSVYFGYTRYMPWVNLAALSALCLVSAWLLRHRLWGKVAFALPLLLVAIPTGKSLSSAVFAMDTKRAMDAWLRESPPTVLYGCFDPGIITYHDHEPASAHYESIFGHPDHVPLTDLRPLCKMVPELNHTDVQPMPVGPTATHAHAPNWEFRVAPEETLLPYSEYLQIFETPNRIDRFKQYPRFACHTLFRNLPQLLCTRIADL